MASRHPRRTPYLECVCVWSIQSKKTVFTQKNRRPAQPATHKKHLHSLEQFVDSLAELGPRCGCILPRKAAQTDSKQFRKIAAKLLVRWRLGLVHVDRVRPPFSVGFPTVSLFAVFARIEHSAARKQSFPFSVCLGKG